MNGTVIAKTESVVLSICALLHNDKRLINTNVRRGAFKKRKKGYLIIRDYVLNCYLLCLFTQVLPRI